MTNVRIKLPTALRPYAQGKESVELDGKTAGEVLEALFERHGGLKKQLLHPEGRLRNFVSVFVNENDIRSLDGLATPLKEGDVISIVPAIAGGSGAAALPSAGARAPALELSREESARYHRHLIMPEVGAEGQRRLKGSSVLLIGAGGLGSPLALYLAAAGVGRIGLVDFDSVEHSNLQRQILHDTGSVGKPKLDSARSRLNALNPNVEIVLHQTRLSSQNALEILRGYDVVADGTDNFPTRYLVNDACVILGKPNVYGSIFRFEGQASVFGAPEGPCYRCLYPEPPPPGLVPSCAEGGVLGVLPGAVGTIQAIEVLKLLLGIGKSLAGRLLVFDALAMEWRELRVKKNPECPVCGENPTIKSLIDYEEFCGLKPAAPKESMESEEMTVEDLKSMMDAREDFVLLDVREPHEYEIARIPGSTLIPLGALPERFSEIDKSKKIVVHCKMGGRSARAVGFLRAQGYRAVNVAGGIDAWAERIDPEVERY